MFNNHNTRGCKKQYLTAETFHEAVDFCSSNSWEVRHEQQRIQ